MEDHPADHGLCFQRDLPAAVVDKFQHVRSVGEVLRHGNHRRLRVFGARGGISIDPYANWGKPGTPWRKTAEERLMYHDMNPELIPFRR